MIKKIEIKIYYVLHVYINILTYNINILSNYTMTELKTLKTRKINNQRISDLAYEMAKKRLQFSGKENSCHMACFLQGRQFKGTSETFTGGKFLP